MLWSVGPIPKETKKTKRNSQIPLTWRFVWNLFDLFFAGFSRIFAPFSFFVSWLECFPTNFSGIFPLPGISQGLASLCLFIFLFFPLLFVWLKFSPVESASFLVFHIYNSFILFLSLFCLQTLVESLLLLIFHILPMKLKKERIKQCNAVEKSWPNAINATGGYKLRWNFPISWHFTSHSDCWIFKWNCHSWLWWKREIPISRKNKIL